jgi:hypothetical protein
MALPRFRIRTHVADRHRQSQDDRESGMRALQRVLASKAPKTGASNTRTNVVRKATCFYFEVQINFNTSRFWEFFVFESLSLDVFKSILL